MKKKRNLIEKVLRPFNFILDQANSINANFSKTKCGIFLDSLSKNHTNAYSASSAFFFFLSLIPAMMVLCTILPYTPISKEYLIEFFLKMVPDIFSDPITSTINDVYMRAGTVLPLASVVLLWTACKGAMAMMDAMNTIYKCNSRTYLIKRFLACIYTLFLLIVIIFALLLVIVGNDIVKRILMIVPQFTDLIEYIMSLRYLAAFIILTLLFSIVYFLMPNKRQNLLWQIPGAVVTSIGWILYSIVFSIFLSHSNAFSVYGSLSIIILLMMWLYFSMYFALIGANINYFLEPHHLRRREEKREFIKQKKLEHQLQKKKNKQKS